MSTRIHLFSELGDMDFSVDCFTSNSPTIWIRSAESVSVSLTLSQDDRDALRAALDVADATSIQTGDQK